MTCKTTSPEVRKLKRLSLLVTKPFEEEMTKNPEKEPT